MKNANQRYKILSSFSQIASRFSSDSHLFPKMWLKCSKNVLQFSLKFKKKISHIAHYLPWHSYVFFKISIKLPYLFLKFSFNVGLAYRRFYSNFHLFPPNFLTDPPSNFSNLPIIVNIFNEKKKKKLRRLFSTEFFFYHYIPKFSSKLLSVRSPIPPSSSMFRCMGLVHLEPDMYFCNCINQFSSIKIIVFFFFFFFFTLNWKKLIRCSDLETSISTLDTIAIICFKKLFSNSFIILIIIVKI